MTDKEYKKIVDKHPAKENRIKNAIIAFIVGGLLGLLGNFLIIIYTRMFDISNSTASIYMIITLIFFACLFTALGFFDNIVKFGRMGIIIPITGFAHSVSSATLDYKKEGLINGFGSNMFKLAGSVILYGVTSAYFFGLLRLIILGV